MISQPKTSSAKDQLARLNSLTLKLVILVAAINTALEVVKNCFDNSLTIWRSQLLTIVPDICVAGLICLIFQRSARQFDAQLKSEVNARKGAEFELQCSRERMAVAVEAAGLGLLDWDILMGEHIWSDKAKALLGLPSDAAQNLDVLLGAIHPEDRQRLKRGVLAAIADKRAYASEFRTVWPDGSTHWRLGKGRALYDKNGCVTRMTGIVVDIEWRKAAEEQQRLHAVAIEAAANAIVVTDANGTVQWTNPAFSRITGYDSREVIGQRPNLWSSGKHEPEFYSNLWRTIKRGECWQGEIINRRKDGATYLEEQTITPVFSESGEIIQFVAIKQDITARRALEDQLRHAQKMDAIGRLAGGVAHDFNNALAVITGNTELMQLKLPKESPAIRHAEQVLKAARGAASLTRQLLAFSRKEAIEPTVLNVNTIVNDLEKMMRRLIGEHIEVQIICESDLANVKADRGAIEQILMNLIVNARDAMPQGGHLLIETANVELDGAPGKKQPLQAKPGKYVAISVTDTGCGIPREIQSHIFDPFFTTKGVGKGTGLGLSIIYGAVKQSEGGISVYSEKGKGTTFRIFLPSIHQPSEVPDCCESRNVLSPGKETILLIEDEDSLREVIRECLKKNGYRVLAAENGERGLEVANKYPGVIHLLLSDVVMPEMSGPSLAQQIARIRPRTKHLFMSGYTNDLVTQHGLLDPHGELLTKPFTMQAMLERIRRVLDKTGNNDPVSLACFKNAHLANPQNQPRTGSFEM